MSKLSRWKNRDKSQGIPKIDSLAEKEVSAGQARLFFLQKMHGGSLFYQYGHLYTFSNPIDTTKIEERFTQLIKRQTILRSNYKDDEESIKVSIRPPSNFVLEKSAGSMQSFFERPFDLGGDLLIRAKVFEGNKLALSMHHIVADRESLMLLQKELFSNDVVVQNKIDFFDFAAWYNAKIDKQEDLDYWKKKLSSTSSILHLPHDHARKSKPSYSGKTLEQKLERKLYQKVKESCFKHQVTPYVFLLASYQVLLSKYSGQDEIMLATPVSNRDRKELESIIGFFNETVVLKGRLKAEQTFENFLQEVKSDFLEALSHKDVSFSSLVKEVNPERIAGINPIFQSMFLYNKTEGHLEWNGSKIREEVVDLGVSKFDITLFVHEADEEINLRLEYSDELFYDDTCKDILKSFIQILELITNNAELKLGDIELYDEEDDPSRDANGYDKVLRQSSILEIIPTDLDSPAVTHNGESISYTELSTRSTTLAKKLREEGLQKNDIVGLLTERSIDMIVGILAIMKAGGAYLPLDPQYPKERLEYMISDSNCKLILSHQNHLLSSPNYIDINGEYQNGADANLDPIEASQLAYIIYTSGSSGLPKGVKISHKNLLYSTSSRFKFYEEKVDVFMLLSSFSFDSSVAGIFWTLSSGGQLLLPPSKIEQDIEEFAALISEHQVSHTLMLPSLYEILLDFADGQQLSSLRNVMVAGEACSSKVVKKHFAGLSNCKLYNEYGPTEATVWCIAHELKEDEEQVAIGKAIPYYKVYLLDKNLKKVAKRVSGELYIAGPGLSPGYLNRPKLTSAKFIQDERLGRLYKTGDLAKRDARGNIIFLGRSDSQVKIRGHRVELDEIKERILGKTKATDVEVLYLNKKLIAYTNSPIEVDLGLPDYMRPSHIVVLDEFPKLPNGKTNLRALPEQAQADLTQKILPAESDLEIKLLEIWKKILNVDQLGVTDNFFSLGGDSLLSIKMMALAKKVDIEISADMLFEFQTIRSLAAHLDSSEGRLDGQILVALKKKGRQAPLFCIHGGGAHVFFYKSFAERLPEDTPVYSFQPKSLDGRSKMAVDIEEMSASYIKEMRKVQAKGPYNILGTCFSNAVALEMANQLTNEGEEVSNLFIVDSAPVHLFGNETESRKQTFRRFMDMLKRGDFHRIRSKISRRIFGTKKWQSPIKEASDSDEVLKETISALNKMYANYNWEPFEGEIRFIRSSEFSERKDKKYHLSQWTKLAKEGLKVSIVEGHHLTLFQEPEVEGLALEVGNILSKS